MTFDAIDGKADSAIKTAVLFVAARVLVEKELRNKRILTSKFIYTREKTEISKL
jgi:hypothetical protein